jgi:hypothetical protein
MLRERRQRIDNEHGQLLLPFHSEVIRMPVMTVDDDEEQAMAELEADGTCS